MAQAWLCVSIYFQDIHYRPRQAVYLRGVLKMSNVGPPPLTEPMLNENGFLTMRWALWFQNLYIGDTGTSWVPTFTSLGSTGTPTFTGMIYRLSQQLNYFTATITPATNTSSVFGTTYIDDFPITIKANGVCHAASATLGYTSGIIIASTNRIYTPTWTNVTVPVTVCGVIEAQ